MDHVESQTGIQVHLENKKMWQKFYPNTEMIITKRQGRIIFPHLQYKIKGLQMEALYQVFLYMERIDDIKYKYDGGKWHELSKGDARLPIRYKEHPHGARPGSHWMSDVVSFSHLKLTNDRDNSHKNLIVVQSMHKFRPVIRIKRVDEAQVEDFRLTLTEFMAVTAYQDSAMVKLKVTHNKFASGFRSNGKKESSETVKEEKKHQSSHTGFPSSWTPAMPFCPSGSFPQNAYSMAASQMNNQFFHAFQANAGNPFFWNPHNLVDTTQKRQSLSSSSDVSTSGTVTPPAGEQQLESLSPTVFDYNGCFPCPQNTPAPFSRQNQSNDSSEMKPLDSFCWNFEQNSTSAMEWNNAFNTNGFIKNENIGNSF